MLDEPTAGMNLTETGEVLEFVRALKQRRLTILLIEHKLALVMSLSDRVVVMDDGEKLVEGVPDTVCFDPRVIEAYLGHKHHEHELPRCRSEQPAAVVPDLRSAVYPAAGVL